MNKKEGSTARNAVSRVVYAKRLPRSLEKEDQKKRNKGGPEGRVNMFMRKVSRVYLLVLLYPRSSELRNTFVELVKATAC
jgi:hypothetical protein